jgi:anti-sigma regulatory factor (Ser/Thr protein kinase)
MEAEPRVEFSLPALAENVSLVRHALAGLAEALEMQPAEIADLKTVVTEACMNAVVHAYGADERGLLEVDAWPEGESLVITVRDYGAGIRPLADVEQRTLRLGLPLIAALTESFELTGAPGKGTQVRMKVPFAPSTTNGAAPPAEPTEETRIKLPTGDLLAPILSRVISMFATRADLSVDELSDAVLLSDALSARGADGFPDGTAVIAVSEQAGSFEVRVGPLVEGGGQRLLDGLRIPSLDASLEGLAEEIRIDAGEDGELLAIRIGRPQPGAQPGA